MNSVSQKEARDTATPTGRFMVTIFAAVVELEREANLNIDQIRRLVGHENEQPTYQSYCFNRLNESQTIDLVRKALSS